MPSPIRTFFRHCPACGRRFEIRLVREERVSETTSKYPEPAPTGTPKSNPDPKILSDEARANAWVILREPVSTVMDSVELQDTYKCGHCGHLWTELRERDRGLRLSPEAAEEVAEQDVSGPSPPKVGED